MGSVDISATVRSILLVEADKKDRTKRYVRTIKSNYDESDYTPIIRNMLKERPIAVSEIIAECEKNDISNKTVRRAGKEFLNVSTKYIDGVAYWELKDGSIT